MDDSRKNGISLTRLNLNMLLIAVLVSIILFVSMQRTQSLYNETHSITQNLVSWKENSYQLQIASDYLTEQMRAFVVTGDKTYLDNYFEEVNVVKRRGGGRIRI